MNSCIEILALPGAKKNDVPKAAVSGLRNPLRAAEVTQCVCAQ
jgi:hypothetical protein